jgi:polyisoprenoid-binding protein YceI
MKIEKTVRFSGPVLAAVLSLVIFPEVWAQEAKPAQPEPPAYQVDPIHSSVLFRIKHMDLAYVYGRFNDVSGTVVFDPAQPEKSSFDVTVLAKSVDTGNEKRDQHLRSPDFFNAIEYPELKFKSKSVRKTGENAYEVEGDFSLHGVTRPLKFEFTHTGSGKGPQGGQRVGGETTFEVGRSDHGMTFMPDALSDEVKVIISMEAVRK